MPTIFFPGTLSLPLVGKDTIRTAAVAVFDSLVTESGSCATILDGEVLAATLTNGS